MDVMKRCTKCSKEYPATVEYFPSAKTNRDRLSSWCRNCSREASRRSNEKYKDKRHAHSKEYYENNREDILEKNRNRYLQNQEKEHERSRKYYWDNHEKERERGLFYLEKHREEARERGRLYYQLRKGTALHKIKEARKRTYWKRREQEIEKVKEWQRKNPEKHRANKSKYRSRVINAPGSHTAEDIKLHYKTQCGRCWWCQVELGNSWHVDHRIPLSRGGNNGTGNIVIACPTCNLSKNDKMPWEWIGRLL